MKRASFTRSRSSYLIQPKPGLHKPQAEPLLSPFPPHVHRYLFSGREIRLCDRSGTSIERIADSGVSVRRQLDEITAKLERQPPQIRLQVKRKTMPIAAEEPDNPYHLNEAICSKLNNFYMEKIRKAEKPKQEALLDTDSDVADSHLPPKPSEQLLHFLASNSAKEHPNRPHRKVIRYLSLEHFSLPSRGNHPGIWSPSTSTSRVSSPISMQGRRVQGGSVRTSPEPGQREASKRIKSLRQRRVFSVMS